MTQALKVAVEALVVNEGCCTPGSFEVAFVAVLVFAVVTAYVADCRCYYCYYF